MLAAAPRLDNFEQNHSQFVKFRQGAYFARRVAAYKGERIVTIRETSGFVIRSEDTNQNHVEREVAGLFRNVYRARLINNGILPFQGFDATMNHHLDHFMHMLPTERWLNHPSRTAPDIAIADYQSIAEQHFYSFKARALDIGGMVLDENVSHVRSFVYKVCNAPVRFDQANRIAVLGSEFLQCCQGFGVDIQLHRVIRTRRAPKTMRVN